MNKKIYVHCNKSKIQNKNAFWMRVISQCSPASVSLGIGIGNLAKKIKLVHSTEDI